MRTLPGKRPLSLPGIGRVFRSRLIRVFDRASITISQQATEVSSFPVEERTRRRADRSARKGDGIWYACKSVWPRMGLP